METQKIKTKFVKIGNGYYFKVKNAVANSVLDGEYKPFFEVQDEYLLEVSRIKKTSNNIYKYCFIKEPLTAQKEAIA